MNYRSLALTIGAILIAAFSTQAQQLPKLPIPETSGIERTGDLLYIVSDETSGYFTYDVAAMDLSVPLGKEIVLIELTDIRRVRQHPLKFDPLELDLEGVTLLGELPIFISERSRSAITDNNLIFDFYEPFTEFGNRGIEGLTVGEDSDGHLSLIALWEGGYPQVWDAPIDLDPAVSEKAMRPVLLIKRIDPVDNSNGAVRVPLNLENLHKEVDHRTGKTQEPFAQRFRAPGLIYDHDKGHVIVYLSSEGRKGDPDNPNPDPKQRDYLFKILQRFDLQGNPIGKPYDITKLDGIGRWNIEGVSWNEKGKSLILIPDGTSVTTIAIVNLPEDWTN